MEHISILAAGPQLYPLSNLRGFGVLVADPSGWSQCAAAPEIWFQAKNEGSRLDLQFVGVQSDPFPHLAYVFYVKASQCRIDGQTYKPKSLNRYVGKADSIYFPDFTLLSNAPKIEMIPLSGGQDFFGADFLLAYQVAESMAFTIK